MWHRNGRLFAANAVVMAVLITSSALAHGAIHERIRAVTDEIRRSPKNAELYLMRGELYRNHEEWTAAGADYDRAQKLNPKLSPVHLARGKMLFESKRLAPAKVELDRFLALAPKNTDGLLTRARIHHGLRRYPAAVQDYTRVIELHPDPGPEHYLARARAQAALGGAQVGAALSGLDEGMRRLGPIVSLESFAIDLELQRGHYDAALKRLDAIIAQAGRKETWQARRGDILMRAGRPTEAKEAYRSALDSIEKLPPGRRNAPATAKLQKDLQTRLARL